MKGNTLTVANVLCMLAIGQAQRVAPKGYDKIEFSNVGFAGSYTPVKKMTGITNNNTCTCEVGDKIWFDGANAPLSDYLSVHFRGPLMLNDFAYYTSENYYVGTSDSSNLSDWSRHAYYGSNSQTAENVTFLNNGGEDSPCLGKALSYAGSDGVSTASKPTVLEGKSLITSDQEFSIFSNISCPKSDPKKGCGVYRSGIPAYYGFGGVTKMFLFNFSMPTEKQANSSSFEFYDMPAIWLLNDQIPRTSQYPTNANCSCWASGCGEYDIFEVMNGTEANHLYSTFHTFQGIEYLGFGIQSYGYIPRRTTGNMIGGVVFDSRGNVVTFVSNSTSFDETLSASEVNKLLSNIPSDETYSTQLKSISASVPSTARHRNAGASFTATLLSGPWYYFGTVLMAAVQFILI